ncbi:MAG: ribosome maturation factor RimM [Vicinamibacteria bacterium]
MSRKFGDMVAIGRIVKPQGRHGEVVVESFSDVPERFPSLREAYVPGPGGTARAVRVTSCWPHKQRFVLKLAGVESIDDAEQYRGLELRIGEEELAALPDGSYYHHQLRGLRVEDERGAPLGEVTEVMTPGATPVLVVKGQGGELMIPLADAFVHEVDLARGRMVATRPEMTVAEG